MLNTNRGRRQRPLALSALLLAVALAACAPGRPGPGGPIDPAQRGMRVYRMGTRFGGAEQARVLAERLFEGTGAQVELKEDNANGLMYVNPGDPSAYVRIDRTTGDFSFSRGLARYYGGGATPGLPDSARAVEIARTRLREIGELPQGEALVVQHVGGLRMSEVQNGATRTVDKLVNVHFGRRIDGVEVGGPGSKIVVTLGENGALVGLHKRWISLAAEERGAAEFLRPAEVQAAATTLVRAEWPRARRVAANRPELGYYDDGHGNVEPAYFVAATIVVEGEEPSRAGHVDHYLGVVPALRQPRGDYRQQERARVQPGGTRDSLAATVQ